MVIYPLTDSYEAVAGLSVRVRDAVEEAATPRPAN